jgi:hypothetical protein
LEPNIDAKRNAAVGDRTFCGGQNPFDPKSFAINSKEQQPTPTTTFYEVK